MGRHRKLDASFKAKVAISTLKPLRVLAMIGIGAVLAVLFYFIGIPQKITGVLTGMKGILPVFLFAWYALYTFSISIKQLRNLLVWFVIITLVDVIVLCISKELIPRFLY